MFSSQKQKTRFLITFLGFILALLLISQRTQAQKIIQYSQYKIIRNEYGSQYIEITPHARLKPSDAKYDKTWGVYAVLICYTVNGKLLLRCPHSNL